MDKWPVIVAAALIFAVTSCSPTTPPASGAGAPDALRPGQEFDDCGGARWCPKMIVIPAGRFTMGSPASETDRQNDEGPQHLVTIAPFASGKFEVTVGEYTAFARARARPATGNCAADFVGAGKFAAEAKATWKNPGFPQSPRDPVVCVSWNDAKAYAQWLSERTGKGYRLLTEAEWEYAARGGTRGRYSWGDSDDDHCAYANGADKTAKRKYADWATSSCDDGRLYTAPVGSYRPNRFGVYDLAGNVWEWVEDCYRDNYRGAPADGSAVIFRKWLIRPCPSRALRGGSWSSRPAHLRPAIRGGGEVSAYGDVSLGFRVARTL